MNNKIQIRGRSSTAILQQNKRDDARLFFKLESSILFCANAQTAKYKQPTPTIAPSKIDYVEQTLFFASFITKPIRIFYFKKQPYEFSN